ncbi:MAG: C4-type zinc ribbon domain-containing protein [Anaerolineales bacterium]|nr:C4-type zinc ribbon domain-containing protein [Anaerolineales bacterium]
MSRASSLFRLQRQDKELDGLRSRQAAIEAELATAGGLGSRRGSLRTAVAELQAAQTANAQAENEVLVLRAKIEATEAALYGGSVRNPKELADLQQESDALHRHLTILENRLLDIMLGLEGAENGHGLAQSDLDSGEAAWSQARQALEGSLTALARQMERLEGEREATMASIPAPDLALYESLRRSYGGTAVAEVLDASCAACGLAVAPSIIQTVRSSPELVRCRQCNRILYAG